MLQIYLQNPLEPVHVLRDLIRYELALVSVSLVTLGCLCLTLRLSKCAFH